jgi:tight adherence protein B
MIASLVFACSFLVALMLAERSLRPSLAVGERLAHYTTAASPMARPSERSSRIADIERRMGDATLGRSIELLLEQADLLIKPFEFVLLAAVSGGAAGLIGVLVSEKMEPAAKVLLVVAMAALGCLAPFLWVYLRRAARRQAFARQLPDALQAICGSLRAGFALGQGFTIVADNLPAPISAEFARALREMNLGATVEQALGSMAQRMQSLDFDLAVSGILINRQVGGNLAELLDNVAATLRERVKLKGFIRVITSQQRLSAWIVVAVPPVVLIVLLLGMPTYMSYLIRTNIGHALLVLSILMQLTGAYFIRRIVSIEV